MRIRWGNLTDLDWARAQPAIAFLQGRLEEQATVDWALQLKPNDNIMRFVVREVLDSPGGLKISEPWRSAWRLVEESWDSPPIENSSVGAYDAQERLGSGDRSGSLIKTIVELVSPRLSVQPFSNLDMHSRKPPKRPRKVEDILVARLTSEEGVDLGVLRIGDLAEGSFLLSLARSLEAAIEHGMHIARRLGWDDKGGLSQLGSLYRVYYVEPAERDDAEEEPDEYHNGIAPSVKLLHAVVARLADIDVPTATRFVRRWKETNSSIHLRLWAALSRDPRITPPDDVGTTLLSLEDREFWRIASYPEIAELRAKRFADLNSDQQHAIIARIRKLPSRRLWSARADVKRVAETRLCWALREMRRIEIAGSALSDSDKAWLEARIQNFPDLVQMTRLDAGFMESVKFQPVPSDPDNRFDALAGGDRLKALEVALSSVRNGWDDDPANRAADWMRQPGRLEQVLVDFETVSGAGAAFAKVWDRFGWAHSPSPGENEGAVPRDWEAEIRRILPLLAQLQETTVRRAIDGISYWLFVWQKYVIKLTEGLDVWFQLWPLAVDATNAQRRPEEDVPLYAISQSPSAEEPKHFDTLNTPAGRLVDIFLTACPNLSENDHPFSADTTLRTMRNAIITAPGESGLIARHRMIEALDYFWRADQIWTQEHLITPLDANNEEARILWQAVAQRRRHSDVLKIIGEAMAEHATDLQLGRETRRSLVFSLVVECLHAFHNQREPAVATARITQTLRLLDDETRASAAEVLQRFIRDNAKPRDKEQNPPSPEQLFRTAVVRFLREVWPQERSLATPGVSKALADLPAAAKDAFAEVVDAVERFLVPFECWSMLEYGLYGEEGGERRLSNIDTQEKAIALLRLLDLTVGKVERSVIPHDLADALEQIGKISPKLTETQGFRRLATAARR